MITKEYLQQELVKRIDGYKRGVETSTDNIVAEMKSILVLVNALPNYEKKYNEALARAKDVKNGPSPHDSSVATVEYIFPEIRESEDERIRKEIIAFLKHYHTGEGDSVTYDNDWLVYLEKQKEQKPNYCHHEVDETGWTEEYRKAYYDGWNDCNMQHEQLKANQKSAEWSEEDERVYDILLNEFKQLYDGRSTSLSRKEVIDVYNFVKSLRPSWKPSEELLEALHIAAYIEEMEFYGGLKDKLRELYKNLKRL